MISYRVICAAEIEANNLWCLTLNRAGPGEAARTGGRFNLGIAGRRGA